ncbi:MAG TPA: GAF domain-containing protein, partial [Dermatophilaceae bacterium]|nr:GAF domain-containing protein [Dermatophilaceae bacterium]
MGSLTAAEVSGRRLQQLLDAVVAVSADLALSDVLAHLVRAACEVVGARYGALGVIGPDGRHLKEFVTYGLTPQERAAIGPLPTGHGILGLLITDPRPLRLADIRDHPSSTGLPANHPPIHTFVGAPIRVREAVFGNLYLAGKQGGDLFTREDEAVLVALAAAAGVAIDNARLYEQSLQDTA